MRSDRAIERHLSMADTHNRPAKREVGRTFHDELLGDVDDPAEWPRWVREAAWRWLALVADEPMSECRDLAGALGLVDQPQWTYSVATRQRRRRVR